MRLLRQVPASSAVTALRKEPDERMNGFSASTTRKNTRPAMISHGQTQSGAASLSSSRCRPVDLELEVVLAHTCRMHRADHAYSDILLSIVVTRFSTPTVPLHRRGKIKPQRTA